MTPLRMFTAVLLAIGIGALMGTLGTAGGGVYVILLTLVFKLPIEQAIGTALALVTLNAFSAALGHWRRGNVAPGYILPPCTSGGVGVFLGGHLIALIPTQVTRGLIMVAFVLISTLSLLRPGEVTLCRPTVYLLSTRPAEGFCYWQVWGLACVRALLV